METISVSNLRINLMKVLKEIRQGTSILITSRGKVIAQLLPPDNLEEKAEKKLEEIREKAVLHDILSPIDEKWEATE